MPSAHVSRTTPASRSSSPASLLRSPEAERSIASALAAAAFPAGALSHAPGLHVGRSLHRAGWADVRQQRPLADAPFECPGLDARLRDRPERAGTLAAWERLTQAVKTGKSSACEALGCDLWDWYGSHPEESGAFSGAMDNLAAQVAAEVTKAIDFSDVGRVVDVGGASGTLVNAVLRAFPRKKGVLLNLPHVVEPVKKTLAALGLAERCEVGAGDFFKSVPQGDVMLLKQILHDWNDEQCITLLRLCAESLGRGGRVLVVEMVISEDGSPSPAHLMDVNMLVLLPGKERTATEYGKLFAAAGLKLERVHATHSPFSIVEGQEGLRDLHPTRTPIHSGVR